MSGSGLRRSRPPCLPPAGITGERRLVWAVAYAFAHDLPPAASAALAGEAAAEIVSWATVEQLLALHGCGAIAYHLLQAPEVGAASVLPAGTIASLRQRYTAGFLQCVREPITLDRLLAALGRAGVPGLVIKGLAVGTWLYPDPVLREHGDIDILVPESRADAAHDALVGLGYALASGPFDHPRPFHGPPLVPGESKATAAYQRPGEIAVDLSYDPLRLFWAPGVNGGDSFDRWWERRQELTVQGRRLPTLGAEDQFVQLARHLHFHDFFRAVSWVDLVRLLRRHGADLDWTRIGGEARRDGIEGSLQRTLELAEQVYAAPVPSAAWRALRPSAPVRALHRRIWPADRATVRDQGSRSVSANPMSPRLIAPRGGRQVAGLALLLMSRQRGRNLGYLVRRLLPSPTWLRAVYGGAGARSSSYFALLRSHRSAVRGLRGGTGDTEREWAGPESA